MPLTAIGKGCYGTGYNATFIKFKSFFFFPYGSCSSSEWESRTQKSSMSHELPKMSRSLDEPVTINFTDKIWP